MNFQRYLSAKRTVDGRALNRRVEARLADELAGRERLRILDVGAGVGATAVRLLDRPWLPDRVTYTALDVDGESVAAARERLPAEACARGYAVRRADDRFVCSRGQRQVELDFRTGDAFGHLAKTDAEFDLVVAHAFVDLVAPADALAAFRGALDRDGLAYCPITFDGETVFEPVADRAFEDRLLAAFHRHLDRSGDSRAGRRLLSLARETGDVVAAGGSDWVVRPRDGAYPADEAYFLHCIVGMVESAVREESAVADDRLSTWVARRRDRIDDAELVYCAHQLDLLVR